VLDLACGSGRHARLLASLGHAVLAVDRDPEALAAAAGPGIAPPSSTTWKRRAPPGRSRRDALPASSSPITCTVRCSAQLAARWRRMAC
jgi:SAM-dependent methyltransferase